MASLLMGDYLLDHPVAGDINDPDDEHQSNGEPHPKRCGLPRLLLFHGLPSNPASYPISAIVLRQGGALSHRAIGAQANPTSG